MRMKRILAMVLAVVMMLCMAVSAGAASVEFKDIAGNFAEESILRWTATGIINGYELSDGTYEFRPNASIKRSEFAKIMAEVLGLTEEAENTFADLSAESWYTPYILRCAKAGIMNGDQNKNANPDNPITREEAFAMYTRTLEMDAGEKSDLSSFEDAGMVSQWAEGSVAAMYNYNAVQGHIGGDLDPKGNLTRAQAVLILDRLVGVYVDAQGNVSTSSAAAEGMTCNYVVVNAQCKEDVKVETAVDAAGKTQITVTVKEEKVTVAPDNDQMPAVVVEDAVVAVDPKEDTPVNIQGATEKENATIETHVHSWDTLKLIKDTNCTEAGEVKYTCACGESKTEVIPVMADGHNYVMGKCTLCGKLHACAGVYGETIKESTCQEGGSYMEKCSCGNSLKVVELEADTFNGHKYDANHVCTLCGAKLADVTQEMFGESMEHWYWGDQQLVKEGSCTEKEVVRMTCVCGKYQDEATYVIHTWSNAGICWECGAKKADCQHEWQYGATGENGEICMRECPICHTEEHYDHSWKTVGFDEWNHIQLCETCGNEFMNEHTFGAGYKCTACGYVCEHAFMEMEITTPATCQEEGIMTHSCVCGYTQTQPLQIDTWHGHNFEIDGDFHVCTLCAETTEEHRYDTTVTTKDPSCTVRGEAEHICDCGDSYTEELPYWHNWDGDVCTECGMNKADCTHEWRWSTEGEQGEICVKECPVCHVREEYEHQWNVDEQDDWHHHMTCVNCECGIGGEHEYNADKECTVCGYVCQHTAIHMQQTVKEATCVEKGEREVTCVCGKTWTEEIDYDYGKGHAFTSVGQDGSHTCVLCNAATIPGHDHHNDVVVKQADCDTLGEMSHVCDCGDVAAETEVIPYTHNWQDGVCTECQLTVADCQHAYTDYGTSGINGEFCDLVCRICFVQLERGEHDDVVTYDAQTHHSECKKCHRCISAFHEYDADNKCIVCGYVNQAQ